MSCSDRFSTRYHRHLDLWRLGTSHFNPELDGDTVWIGAILAQESDGVSRNPEYAHGMPVFSKTHLDWIVSGESVINIPQSSCFPSPDGGGKAHASLVQTLTV